MRRSENELQTELDLPGACNSSSDPTSILSVAPTAVDHLLPASSARGVRKVGGVRDVEELRPELEVGPLRNRRILD